ncbi:hypothetical protein [Endozoicomonas acroporae]|uniref:hypothetical protein n=1 Tax=Endozoicomonas acroporae TaxID=1701104 RepID=UPI003D7AB218
MVKPKKKVAFYYKASLMALSALVISGCNQMKYYSVVVHNDSGIDLYDIKVISSSGESLYPGHPGTYHFLGSNLSGGTVSLPMKSIPDYVTIEWGNQEGGELVKKKLNVEKKLPKEFWGGVIFSVLENRDVEISWKLRGGESERYINCGGYIFEKYYYRAKPKIDKNIADWQSYLKQKEADLKAGLTDKYKKPKYYDQVTEADFRCNDLLYLKP